MDKLMETVTDITNESAMRDSVDTIIRTNYDFLVVIDIRKNSAIKYRDNSHGTNYANLSDHFEEDTQNYLRQSICDDHKEKIIEEFTLNSIVEKLVENHTYNMYYSVKGEREELLKKKLCFSYISFQNKIVLMTRMDITEAFNEQETKNRELRNALMEAERANAAKTEFLARISHEIKTPMNAIMGMTEIAKTNLFDPVFVNDCIEKSQAASRYLLSLINDILDMAKMENDTIVLNRSKFDSLEFTQNIAVIMESQARKSNIKLSVESSEDLKRFYVGDGGRLQQILVNIINNAIKFTASGGEVRMSVKHVRDEGKFAVIQFEISDTGIGIGEEFMPHLFQPFSKEHSNTTSEYAGNGLGLAISKRLANSMGGDITCFSQKGIGTTFYVEVFLEYAQEEKKEVTSGGFEGKKLLLVDDYELNIMVAEKLLTSRGFDVIIARNGREAVDQFEASTPYYYDAILMDIRMPIMDGLDATKCIRAYNRQDARTIPIVAMTANTYAEDVETSKRAGMNEHLAKPIDPKKLFATLHNLMR